MNIDLELSADQLQELGEFTVRFINSYLQDLEHLPVQPPDITPEKLRALFDESLPWKAQELKQIIDEFSTRIAANSSRVGHPRFLGWIRTSPLAAAVYAEALAAVLNQSVAVWEGAPAATEVELRVIEWIKEICGYAPSASGILLSGGSMANFVCLLAARSAVDPQARDRGLYGQPPFTVYLTHETHYCVPKAVDMMGIGRQHLRFIPVDSDFRMDPAALDQQIRSDLQDGFRPLAVVATLGTVNTGACDDLLSLGEVCRKHGVWLHVDGVYGGTAHLIPEKRHLAAGLEQADSLAFDPHKSLYMPFEAGCALVRDPSHLPAAFAVETEYLPNSGDPAGPFHFRDYGPQLSRSFRALKIYLSLKLYGVEAFRASLSHQYRLAAELAERLQSAPDFELLAPPTLGIVAFRYSPPGLQNGDVGEQQLNELNERIARALQRSPRAFLSMTRLQGRTALRACFVSHRTRSKDLEIVMDEVRRLGGEL
ncbi:MAG: hypothetical protein GX495_00170 [Chloroflexi bacterium]|nr:hypothetical protein [Chloroflexota bacterium]